MRLLFSIISVTQIVLFYDVRKKEIPLTNNFWHCIYNTDILYSRSPGCPCADGKNPYLKLKRSICHGSTKIKPSSHSPNPLKTSAQFLLICYYSVMLDLAAGCYSSHEHQKTRPRDALSAEGVRTRKPMQYVTIPCTSEVCTVTEGTLTRVYLQVFLDHMQSLHGASTSAVLKT